MREKKKKHSQRGLAKSQSGQEDALASTRETPQQRERFELGDADAGGKMQMLKEEGGNDDDDEEVNEEGRQDGEW